MEQVLGQVAPLCGDGYAFREIRLVEEHQGPQTYAVWEHREHISAIAMTWKYIWNQGMSDAGCQVADSPAFERYGEEFDGRTGLGGVELWVPVKV